jgi:hypothetical protein
MRWMVLPSWCLVFSLVGFDRREEQQVQPNKRTECVKIEKKLNRLFDKLNSILEKYV